MEAIFYDDTLAAIATRTRVYLAPEVDQLEVGNPRLRMVAMMCLYARDVQEGVLPGPYDQQAAEFFARSVLAPLDEFEQVAGRDDEQLAQHFGVPAREIAARRRDLALAIGTRK